MTVVIWSLLLASLKKNCFAKRPSGAPPRTLSKLNDISVGFVSSSSFETVCCFICGLRRVAVVRYRTICLVLVCASSMKIQCHYIHVPFHFLYSNNVFCEGIYNYLELNHIIHMYICIGHTSRKEVKDNEIWSLLRSSYLF